MRSTFKRISEIPNTTKAEYKQAISEWVKSLPQSKARASSVFVSGVAYSPLQILEEIEHETDLGKEFLAGLYSLNCRLSSANKSTSIVGLIRQSS
jgi:hypothetical protein